VSPTLVDPLGSRVVYDQQANSFVNTLGKAYVNVTGNLEVIVLPIFAAGAETFNLSVTNVAASVRGGVDYFGADGNQVRPLTAELRSGTTDFLLSYGSTAPPLLGSGRPAAAVATVAAVTQVVPSAASPTLGSVVLTMARTDSASVTTIGPVFQVNVASVPLGPSIGIAPAVAASGTLEIANSTGLTGPPPAASDASVRQVLSQLAEAERVLLELVRGMGNWIRGRTAPLPGADNAPAPALPRMDELPMPPPDAEPETQQQTQEAIGAMPDERSQEARVPAGNFKSVVGLGVCLVGLSASGPTHRRRRIRHEGRAHG